MKPINLTPFHFVWKKVVIFDKHYSKSYLKSLKNVVQFVDIDFEDVFENCETFELHRGSKQLPKLPNVEHLKIVARNLSIPTLSKLKTLDIEYSIIKNLETQPITHMRIINSNIENNNDMPNLQELAMYFSAMKLCYYPNLKSLNCQIVNLGMSTIDYNLIPKIKYIKIGDRETFIDEFGA